MSMNLNHTKVYGKKAFTAMSVAMKNYAGQFGAISPLREAEGKHVYFKLSSRAESWIRRRSTMIATGKAMLGLDHEVIIERLRYNSAKPVSSNQNIAVWLEDIAQRLFRTFKEDEPLLFGQGSGWRSPNCITDGDDVLIDAPYEKLHLKDCVSIAEIKQIISELNAPSFARRLDNVFQLEYIRNVVHTLYDDFYTYPATCSDTIYHMLSDNDAFTWETIFTSKDPKVELIEQINKMIERYKEQEILWIIEKESMIRSELDAYIKSDSFKRLIETTQTILDNQESFPSIQELLENEQAYKEIYGV